MSETKKENTTTRNQIIEGILGVSAVLIGSVGLYKLGESIGRIAKYTEIGQSHLQRSFPYFQNNQINNILGMTKSQLIDDIIKNFEILVSPADPVYEWLQVSSNRNNLKRNLQQLNMEQLTAIDGSIILTPTRPPVDIIKGEITTYKIGEKLKEITGNRVMREVELELPTIGTAPNSPLREQAEADIDIGQVISEDEPLLNALEASFSLSS